MGIVDWIKGAIEDNDPSFAFDIDDGVLVQFDRNCGITDVEIPNGVVRIGNSAFLGCDDLRSVIIPEGVTCIGAEAFCNCRKLERVVIPDSVRTIGARAFATCIALKSISLPKTLSELGVACFSDCVSLEEMTLPDNITFIGDSTFRGCSGLRSIEVGGRIKTIGNGAFCGCRKLSRVLISDRVEHIGNFAFQGCISLQDIALPKSLKMVLSDTFKKCIYLRRIEVPSRVTLLGDSAFEGCTSLREIILHEGLTTISSGCFASCIAFEELHIPESVTEIGNFAFTSCMGRVVIHDVLPNQHKDAFNGFGGELVFEMPEEFTTNNLSVEQAQKCWCYDYQKNGTICITGYIGEDTDVVVPRYIGGVKVTAIGYQAFSKAKADNGAACAELADIKLPESLTEIGAEAFGLCEKLKRIRIPDMVNTIGNFAFGACYSLEEIILPERLTTLGKDPMMECTSLKEIFLPRFLRLIEGSVFRMCRALERIEVHPDNNYMCSVDGVLYSKDRTVLMRCPEHYPHEVLVTDPATKTIRDSSFVFCNGVKTLELTESVTELDSMVFFDCKSIKRLVVNSPVRYTYNTFDTRSDMSIICTNVPLSYFGRSRRHGMKVYIRAIKGYLIGRKEGIVFDPLVDESYLRYIDENREMIYCDVDNDTEVFYLLLEARFVKAEDIPLLLKLATDDTQLTAQLLEYSRINFPDRRIDDIYNLD